ncbi:uncharacterized protein LOC131335362 isoform X2 [Rhododendron vialii]|uniref:uncharacterized protein LOC131335362 isoform X2 n=1 Tax=Rhododendron vialii TaxID=182163 RepID=UPI00265DAA97|nr:uncharacterized protein LOC131335362 isoform X2 [Rhododendron vialii]
MSLLIKPLPCLLLPIIFILFSSTLHSISHGAPSTDLHSQTNHIPVDESENGVVGWGVRRSVLENSSITLAAQRTRRKDPLNNFNYYIGGWNIRNKHYFASVGFTGITFFLIAAIWFVGFGLCLLLLCCCFCCCRREPYGYSRAAYALSLILLLLFTVAAVIGCIVLYTGQGQFHNTTSDTLDYVVSQANTTVANLENVSDYLAAAKSIGIDQVSLPTDVQNNIDNVDNEISSAATTLQSETKKNKKKIEDVLDTVRLALIIIAAVMLLLALLGFLFSILGLQFLVYVLVIVGWILIAGTFILAGVFLVVHNMVGDTCVAMDQWVRHPTAHTALDDILPCVDNATAQATLSQSQEVTYQLVGIVNGVIANVSNVNVPPSVPQPLYFNQSGPLVPLLCNPFNADLSNRTCAAGELDFENATQVWQNYVCKVSSNNTCTTVGRLTPTMYSQMINATNVSYGLYHYGPFLVDLLDCSFVRETFAGITQDHCPGLKRYSMWVYIGLAMVSAAVMLSLIFWVIYARERRHRKYTKLVNARHGDQHGSFGEKRP